MDRMCFEDERKLEEYLPCRRILIDARALNKAAVIGDMNAASVFGD